MTQETGLVSDAHSVAATVNDPAEGAYVELAERLCCAYGSYSMGVTYETYRKNYFPGKDKMEEFWLQLAEFVAKKTINLPT